MEKCRNKDWEIWGERGGGGGVDTRIDWSKRDGNELK